MLFNVLNLWQQDIEDIRYDAANVIEFCCSSVAHYQQEITLEH